MPKFYYSNWNRNNRKKSVKNLISKFFGLFGGLFAKLKRDKKFRKKSLRLVWYALAAFIIFVGGSFAVFSLSLPDPNKLNARIIPQSTKIYARDGSTLLYEIHGEAKRTLVELDQIPDFVKEATIAIEEKNFYSNHGVDWKGILRAVFKNVTRGELKGEGGSTITQQFVRNAILTREKTFTRKFKEVILAIQIERKFSKDEILKLYLNEIPYGQNAYGIEAASQSYFNKHVGDLTLAEAAYLAALPQGPTFYSPNGPHRELLDARKDLVLSEMEKVGYITATEREQAQNEEVEFNKIKDAILAPHFVLYIQDQLVEKYGEKTLEEGGLQIITSLDYDLQQAAEQAIADRAERNQNTYNASNAALVAIAPKTGQILAMVGSRDYFDDEIDGQVNIAIRPRQPGSSVKPYVYASAFKQGLSPATMLIDVPTVFGKVNGADYAPGNYDGKSYGVISLRQGFAGSLNIPAVKTLALTGVKNAIETMKDLGITSDINTDKCGLSLVLGGCEISLLDHVSAIGVIANSGLRHEPVSILKVTDADGNVLEEYEESEGDEVLDPQVAFEVTDVMTDDNARSFIFGSNSALTLPGRTVAAKTGTTQLWREGWTVGFTPTLAAGVWVGNNDFSRMRAGADGVVVAAPIWNQFMRRALEDTPAETFPEPSGIQHILVDTLSGKLPTEYTPQTKTEIFADFAVPSEFDDVHVPVKINKLNGKLATDQTPEELVETRVFTVLRSEQPQNPDWEIPVQTWAREHGFNNLPTETDDGSVSALFPDEIKIVSPASNQEVKSLPFTIVLQVNGPSDKITSVEYELEGEVLGRVSEAPFSLTVAAAKNGWQTLQAQAVLTNNSILTNSIRVNINASQ